MKKLTNNQIVEHQQKPQLPTVPCSTIFGPDSQNIRRALSRQAWDSVWAFGKNFEQLVEARKGVTELWQLFAPADATEALLVTQMMGAHNAAMGWLRRSTLETLPIEARERAANKAAQFMGIFQNLSAALDKHRGKGQQKMTVEHVTVVNAGGQAIVGNVEAPAIAAPAPNSDQSPAPMIDGGSIVPHDIQVRSRVRRAND